jgi:hypothetical protein
LGAAKPADCTTLQGVGLVVLKLSYDLPEIGKMRLVLAWICSAVAFVIAFEIFLFLREWLAGTKPLPPFYYLFGPYWFSAVRSMALLFGSCMIFQLLYGGGAYLVLTRTHLWNILVIEIAYLLPVVLYSWASSDTTQDLIGTIPWLGAALVVGLVTWLVAPGPINPMSA